MAHPRKLVRDAVVAILKNATAAGARVYATRIEPIRKSPLPAIAVYTLSEETEPTISNTAPRELVRIVKVEVSGFVAHSDAIPVDDAMDALAELSLIHISEPTRLLSISYAVFCLKK